MKSEWAPDRRATVRHLAARTKNQQNANKPQGQKALKQVR
ncbi:hypothetical protein BSU04_07970 [Caballeronia sordidicola]|uniref:Uncharacterized protein n=1 Tax=Caballeronia sordidicola TaxID=196367 RepID=A0A226X6P3_CABSO|nr:hypothetical protein BSU04_07970 [Caballeronia sordidicola]